MARTTKPLTAKEIGTAKPKKKKYKLSDGNGLFLEIRPNGSTLWRLKYRFDGREREYSIGVYPDITLANARKEKNILRELIASGIDPNKQKKNDKIKNREIEAKSKNTFYLISQKWLNTRIGKVSENYHIRLGRALENYIYPSIKDKPIEEVTRLEVIAILEELKGKGIEETARRTKTLLNQIFRYAVTYEYIPHNIIADIDTITVLGHKSINNYPAITDPKELKKLLTSMNNYTGDYSTAMALKVLPYLFVRSFNIRYCEWSELDLEAKLWSIPAYKMKTKKEFLLPLPHQVVSIFREMEKNKLSDKYVFPSSINHNSTLSNNTISNALRRMGYTKEQIVPHGFRTTFSTTAYEYANKEDGHGFTAEVIEALLAHKQTNKVIEAYNRAEYKEPMRELIQWYADWLEGLK